MERENRLDVFVYVGDVEIASVISRSQDRLKSTFKKREREKY